MRISKKTSLRLFSIVVTITYLITVFSHSVFAEQDGKSLYSHVMDTYKKDYVDVSNNRKKLEDLQTEYSIAKHANLQAESFEYIKEYAKVAEQEINTKIDDDIEKLQLSQHEVSLSIESNIFTMSPKELSKLNRAHSKYQEEIDSLLKDKTSLTSLFNNPTYDSIDTSTLEISIKEQEDIISYNSSNTNTDLGKLEELKRPFTAVTRVTSRAGYRTDPIKGAVAFHNATDYGMPTGTELYSLFNGTVVRADNTGDGYGNNIKIDCGNGIIIHYAHLSSIKVSVGDTVTQNQLIGLSGNTGRSTGPHLHLSLFYKGEVLDVERLFE